MCHLGIRTLARIRYLSSIFEGFGILSEVPKSFSNQFVSAKSVLCVSRNEEKRFCCRLGPNN